MPSPPMAPPRFYPAPLRLTLAPLFTPYPFPFLFPRLAYTMDADSENNDDQVLHEDESETTPSKKDTKYDRQLRLWGVAGQKALMESHVLLVNAGEERRRGKCAKVRKTEVGKNP